MREARKDFGKHWRNMYEKGELAWSGSKKEACMVEFVE
jgi:hypothetical protein